MASLNKIFLIGNLTRDPELKYAPSGTAVVAFGMATNRNFTSQSGEKKQETCFVRVTVWGKQAEACGKYLSKGSLVFVEGRLQYRAWTGQDGQKKSTLEVRADRVQFLGKTISKGSSQAVEPEMSDMPMPGFQKTADEPFLPDEDIASEDERDLT